MDDLIIRSLISCPGNGEVAATFVISVSLKGETRQTRVKPPTSPSAANIFLRVNIPIILAELRFFINLRMLNVIQI